MTITKKMRNLEVGTIIEHTSGYIILTSEFDSFHGAYEYHDIEFDENGEMIEEQTGGYVTLSDLIGSNIS